MTCGDSVNVLLFPENSNYNSPTVEEWKALLAWPGFERQGSIRSAALVSASSDCASCAKSTLSIHIVFQVASQFLRL